MKQAKLQLNYFSEDQFKKKLRPMESSSQYSEILSSAVSVIQNRPSNGQQTVNNENLTAQTIHDDHTWRNILSFWILGLCNNYGFVVMLSAAFDIIKRFNGVSV